MIVLWLAGGLIAVIFSAILENVASYSLPLFLFIFSIFLTRKQNIKFFPLLFSFVCGFYIDILNKNAFYYNAIIFPVLCVLFFHLKNIIASFVVRSVFFSIVFSAYLFIFKAFTFYYLLISFILFFISEHLYHLFSKGKEYVE